MTEVPLPPAIQPPAAAPQPAAVRVAAAQTWAHRLHDPLGTVLFFLRRMGQDNIVNTAAALCYSTALGVVPAVAVILGSMATFPAFDGLRAQVQTAITTNLLPDTSLKLQDQLQHFVDAAGSLTGFGVVGLAVTSVLLLVTIEAAFNRIFRVEHPRPWFMRLIVFWAVLTVGPFLIGVSVSLVGYFTAIASADHGALSRIAFGDITPMLMTWILLTFLYRIIPNRAVNIRDAAIGGATTAVLLEGLHLGFATFIAQSAYGAIYGAMAAVPVFLLWIYCLWIIVMAGAVITAALPDWRLVRDGHSTGPGLKLALGLAIIDLLAAAFKKGVGLTPEAISHAVKVPPAGVLPVLEELRRVHYVAITEGGLWVLVRDLSDVPLVDLVHRFGLGIGPAVTELRETPLGERVCPYLEPAADAERKLLSVCLDELLSHKEPDAAPK